MSFLYIFTSFEADNYISNSGFKYIKIRNRLFSSKRINSYDAELILYKPWGPKGFLNLKSS